MNWPEVVALLVAEVDADPEILAALGGVPRLYPSDDPHAGALPSLAYTVIVDDDGENADTLDIQWDIFGREEEVATLYGLLKRRVTSRSPRTLGGVALWMDYAGGRSHPAPEPGTAHYSFDARYSTAHGA